MSPCGTFRTSSDVRLESGMRTIVLKKSFSPAKRKILRPLMRFARGDVRDHIISVKEDHRPAYRRYEALQGYRPVITGR